MACSLASLGGTLAALMGAACDVTGLAETTVLGDLVAEVLGWDLDSLSLGEGREGRGVGKRSMIARKSFLDTLGWKDGGGLGVEEEVPFLQEDGPDGGLVAALERVDREEEEAEEEDLDNRNNIIMQYFQ
ncbi:hypothetical protein NDU88_001120 [Pleurodeles waltl]|uniref:Uncharacterized protein n=1 Tax=Pleurodeles waltl TaxID=8319 RepID=A0AAV7NBP2_PLEWA|nr:hypothetical protein NDU88_001120 [Pleurodeles waltl]